MEQGLQRDGKDGCHGTKGSAQQVPPPVTPFPHLTPPPPAQDVARRILAEDVTQIEYYTERVNRMVGKVLTGNGITRYDQGAYDLVGGVAEGFCAAVELSDAGTWPKANVAEPLREELLQLCRQRLDAFRMQRGEEVLGGDGQLDGVNT